ncbi:MAG: enoyl-CoA hydratase/isomerase family protein [Bacteroidota bacterium]
MQDGHIQQKFIQPDILQIEFYHPKHNSLPSHLLKELKETIEQAGENIEVDIIILKSGGDRTFCAGASFDELIAIDNLEKGKQFFSGFANVINACRKCPKIIIARVQGKAVGGGVGLASAVDYCLATKYASVKLSELNIGIGPFVIAPAVERKIGLSAMSQMTLDADTFFSPEWARQKGLYAEVCESTEVLDERVLTLATYLQQTNPEARRQLKTVFWKDCEHWDELLAERAAISGELVLSTFTKKALGKYK